MSFLMILALCFVAFAGYALGAHDARTDLLDELRWEGYSVEECPYVEPGHGHWVVTKAQKRRWQ